MSLFSIRSRLRRLLLWLVTLQLLVCNGVNAKPPKLSEFDGNDNRQHELQWQWIDTIAREQLGERLRHSSRDLIILQRIIDRELIKRDDSLRLQALGVVLGNRLADQYKLKWKIYSDDQGPSRALCVPNTDKCLFPITMLSRRIEVGLNPNVDKIYQDAAALIQPYLPKLPYQVD